MGRELHFEGGQIGAIFATMGIASLVMPGIIGIIADKWFNAERLYGLCHIAGAGCLFYASTATGYDQMYWAMLLNLLVYMPTLSLANTVSYNALEQYKCDLIKDFPPIRGDNALLGDLFTTDDRPYGDDVDDGSDTRGHVVDLIAPVLVLIAACIFGMVYTGGFFEGVDFVTAFANCSASMGLVLGSAIALMFTFVFYRVRGVMTFQDFAACIPEGFKAMVSPMLILTLAWTLSGMTGLLGAKYYVASLLSGSAAALQYLLPIIIFVVAVFLAFATGTSWGTFSILVPIVCHAFPEGEMLVVSIAACLSGAVCGDHCSPISDTTIMASAGAHCSHVNHVSTQLPYAMTAAAVSAGCYLLCGAAQAVLGDAANTLTSFVLLACAIAIELVVLSIVRARMGHTGK